MSVYYITNNSIDNFEETGIIYIGIEDHILTEKELKEQFKDELYKDTTIFESDSPFVGYPIRENNTIRSATKVELIEMGYQELQDGEYIQDNEVVTVKRPSWQYKWNKEQHKWLPDENKLHEGEYIDGEEIKDIVKPHNMLKPKWNKQDHIWEELATENEINLHQVREQYNEYKPMDTPLTFERMEEQGVLEDYKSMMNELEDMIITLSESTSAVLKEFSLPEPSKQLLDFKNKFNKLF